jgi:hypothetical protein
MQPFISNIFVLLNIAHSLDTKIPSTNTVCQLQAF